MSTYTNECRSCKMKFETAQQLANHTKRFCVGSDYDNLEKLEKKYQQELKLQTNNTQNGQQMNGLTKNGLDNAPQFQQIQNFQGKQNSNGINAYGAFSLQDLQGKMKSNDEEFKQLERIAQRRKEEEMQQELLRMKEERLKIREKQRDESFYMLDLLKEIQMRNDKELRAKIEKDQIRRAIVDVEKGKQTSISQEKKRELEKMVNERENLRVKEIELIDNIEKMEQEMRSNPSQQGNRKIADVIVQERADKIMNLRLRRDQNENERNRIMGNLELIQNGELTSIKKGNMSNLGLMAARNMLGDQQQTYPSQREQEYNGNTYQPKNNYEEQIRENPQQPYMDRERDRMIARENNTNNNINWNNVDQTNVQGYADNQIRGLDKLKDDYLRNGGTDTKFLHNLENLQKFYDRVKSFKKDEELKISRERAIKSPLITEKPIIEQPMPMPIQQMPLPVNNDPIYVQPQIQQAPQEDQLNALISQKDNENQNLKQRIEELRKKLLPGNGLQEMNNPFQIFIPGKEYIFSNEPRNVDLNKEERTLLKMAQEEVDELRIMSKIPVGTELYRFKMEQFKEISTVKTEIEKVIQEQRIQRMRRNFEKQRRDEDRRLENERWIDDQRKWIIAGRIRKDIGPDQKDYNPDEGFIIYWDFQIGLPKRTNYCQVVFGIYNHAETIYAPKLVDPHDCEVESANSVRCIIGDQHHVMDIPTHPDTLKIIEVQLPYSRNPEENIGRTESYGWTQMDIFDFKRLLRRGKWKCPLYYGPTDTNIMVEEIKSLEPIPGAWIFFRIAYPNDEEFGVQRSLYPEQVMHEYIIPTIHLRNRFGRKDPPLYEPEPQPQEQQQPPQQQQPLYEPQEEADTKPVDDGQNRGLKVGVLKLKNYHAKDQLRVLVGLLEDVELLTDDQGVTCAFNTSIHDPNSQEKGDDIPEDQVVKLLEPNPRNKNLNNKELVPNLTKWHEEYKFLRNLPELYRRNKKDIWLGYQIVEMKEEGEGEDLRRDFKLIGWNYIKVCRPDGSIRSGLYNLELFEPPIKRPPVDPNKQKLLPFTLDTYIDSYVYSDEDFIKKPPTPKIEPVKAPTPEKKKDVGGLDHRPYIPNLKRQYHTKPFYKKMGIDFYIDQLRFLPDKVTVSKIYMDVYNIKTEKIFATETCLPDMNSMSYMPTFNFRRELRADHIDPTSLVLLTIVTVDKSSNENRIAGFSAIPLFVSQKTNEPPKDVNEQDPFLHDGLYQIPIFSQQLDRTPPFDFDKINKLERIPCGSVLVRIYRAPTNPEGTKALSIDQIDDQREWLRLGLYKPRPIYAQAVYNNYLCPIMKSEEELYPFRQNRSDAVIREAAYLLVKGKGINKKFKDDELYDWLDNNVTLTQNCFLLDPNYIVKYSPQAGVQISVDGLHQVPNPKVVYIAIYSLNPPGTFYPVPQRDEDGEIIQGGDNDLLGNQQQIDSDTVQLNSTFKWDSPSSSPQFMDNFAQFRESFHENMAVVVEIRSVSFENVDAEIKPVGWTLIPVFTRDGYVKSGIYQMPMIRGAVNAEFLAEMRKPKDKKDKRELWDILMENMSNKRLKFGKWLEFTSVLVRLVDGQREGHYSKRYECSRMNYQYLPKDTIKKWSYNEPVELQLKNTPKLMSIIPNKETPANYQRKVTEACALHFGMTKYY